MAIRQFIRPKQNETDNTYEHRDEGHARISINKTDNGTEDETPYMTDNQRSVSEHTFNTRDGTAQIHHTARNGYTKRNF